MKPTPENIAKLIAENLLLGTDLNASSPLFELGLDSMAIMQFTVLCEDHFNISLEPGDLTGSNFETPNAIAALLNSREK